jgi:hypothetical protein
MQRRTRPVLPALQGTVRIASGCLKLNFTPHITLRLHTQTGKNRCARVIARHLRACSEQDLTYGQVLFILSQPARAHIWRTLTRFPRRGYATLGFTDLQADFLKLFHLLTFASQLNVRKTVLSRLLFIRRYYKILQGFLLQYLEKSLYSLVYEQGSGFIQNRLQNKGDSPEVGGRGYPHPQQLSCDHYPRPPHSQRHPLGSGRAARGKRERRKRDSLLKQEYYTLTIRKLRFLTSNASRMRPI